MYNLLLLFIYLLEKQKHDILFPEAERYLLASKV